MNTAIEIEDLCVSFRMGREHVNAVRDLSLSVDANTVFGFLGPNGAGKTTTMHILLGFIEATSGSARIFGSDVRQSIARQRIGYLPEHPQHYPFLSGRELLYMAGNLFQIDRQTLRTRVDALLEDVGLKDAANRRIATYSRGMLQRIGIAQTLVNDPDLVILDEPTSGLDPIGRMDVRKIIASLRERGKTVFFSSHELSEVELVCDQLAILSQGQLVAQGARDELVRDGDSLEQYFLDTLAKGAS